MQFSLELHFRTIVSLSILSISKHFLFFLNVAVKLKKGNSVNCTFSSAEGQGNM